MNKKHFVLIVFFIFHFFVFKTVASASDIPRSNQIQNTFDKVSETVVTNTPPAMKKFIISNFEALEGWRAEQFSQMEIKQSQARSEVKALEQGNKDVKFLNEIDENTTDEELNKPRGVGKEFKKAVDAPFVYAKLYVFTFLAFIFGSIIAFYGSLFLLLWTVLKFLWRLVFRR